jgi:hypothetical protein
VTRVARTSVKFAENPKDVIGLDTELSRKSKSGFPPRWRHKPKQGYFFTNVAASMGGGTGKLISPSSVIQLSPLMSEYTQSCKVSFPWEDHLQASGLLRVSHSVDHGFFNSATPFVCGALSESPCRPVE